VETYLWVLLIAEFVIANALLWVNSIVLNLCDQLNKQNSDLIEILETRVNPYAKVLTYSDFKKVLQGD
jgi:hypothetical protein